MSATRNCMGDRRALIGAIQKMKILLLDVDAKLIELKHNKVDIKLIVELKQ